MSHELSCDKQLAVVADWTEHSGEEPIQKQQTIYPLPSPVRLSFDFISESINLSSVWVDVSSFHPSPFFYLKESCHCSILLSSVYLFNSTMLSTLRVTSRQAVSRESGMRVLMTGVRAGSTWANVPQGPPVCCF